MQLRVQSFTIRLSKRATELTTPVHICPAYDPSREARPPGADFNAIWDTGATKSVISQPVVTACNLKPTSMALVQGIHGQRTSPVYRVNVELPNSTGFAHLDVTLGIITGADVLIGMDVIAQGDFAVTNRGGKTTFSYRYPSQDEIDFQKGSREGKSLGRNDPCFCGSGEKYKHCHGNNL